MALKRDVEARKGSFMEEESSSDSRSSASEAGIETLGDEEDASSFKRELDDEETSSLNEETSSLTSKSLDQQVDAMDSHYAITEYAHTENDDVKNVVSGYALELAPSSSFHNNKGKNSSYTADGIYTGIAYRVNDLFTSKDMESDEPIPSQVVKVSYIVNDETSIVIKRRINPEYKNQIAVYPGYDNTPLIGETDEYGNAAKDEYGLYKHQAVDAIKYLLCTIDEKDTNKTAGEGGNNYWDDTITFNYKGEYVVTVYSQGKRLVNGKWVQGKRVKRQFDIHVLKKPVFAKKPIIADTESDDENTNKDNPVTSGSSIEVENTEPEAEDTESEKVLNPDVQPKENETDNKNTDSSTENEDTEENEENSENVVDTDSGSAIKIDEDRSENEDIEKKEG